MKHLKSESLVSTAMHTSLGYRRVMVFSNVW